MEALRSYGLSLICGAMICGIFTGIVQDGLFQKQIQLLCGLFLALTIVKPLVQLDLPSLDGLLEPFGTAAEEAAADGVIIYQQAIAQSIQEEAEAYICSKASALEADLCVRVSLRDDTPPVPNRVILEGEISPEKMDALQTILEEELHIPKERQTWIGPN